MKFNAKQQELRRYNFRSDPDTKLAIEASSIPTLVPEAALKAFGFAEDPEPYFKVEAIEFPTKANGIIYTEDFWKSFVSKMNERPIPGSARGHEMRWGARGPTDLLLIGGRVDSRGGGAGTVYLKNYIPPKGESGDNATFIAMNKAGMVDYSVVAYTRDEITQLPDGGYERKCVESVGGERNDAVDFAAGAMDMKTNAEADADLSATVEVVKKLISTGKVDRKTNWSPGSGDTELAPGYPYGRAGRVFRSALRSSAARAAHDGHPEITDAATELIKCIDGKSSSMQKGDHMDKEELLKALGVMKANAQITLAEVAGAMDLGAQIVTPEHVEALRVVNALKAEGVADPLAAIKAAKEREKADAAAVRNAALETAFGKEDGGKNLLRVYAGKQIGEASGEELTKRINALKEDPVALKLSAGRADPSSPENIIGSVDHKDGAPATATERRVDKL